MSHKRILGAALASCAAVAGVVVGISGTGQANSSAPAAGGDRAVTSPAAGSAQISVRAGETRTYTIDNGQTVVTASVRPTTANGAAANGIAAQSCWIGRIDYKATSLGSTQYIWRHEVHWCFNGSTAAGAHVNDGINVRNHHNWKWRGKVYASKRNMSSYMDVRNQGLYEFCIPNCWQHQYPTHHGKYYRGRFTTTVGHAK